jgi:hypothetical protein
LVDGQRDRNVGVTQYFRHHLDRDAGVAPLLGHACEAALMLPEKYRCPTVSRGATRSLIHLRARKGRLGGSLTLMLLDRGYLTCYALHNVSTNVERYTWPTNAAT